MKIEVLSKKIICSNEYSMHRYFAWPSVTRLQDKRLAMVASGFRQAHICPFGKAVISYSSDEGRTWSLPAVVIDTPLDDRDAGIVAFGERNVIVTSFNNSTEIQRQWANEGNEATRKNTDMARKTYVNAYLDFVEENGGLEKYLGSTFRISQDGGNTFGELKRIPVRTPHGPAVMKDGNLLYVGDKFFPDDYHSPIRQLSCYKVFADGSYEFLSELENAEGAEITAEPHAIVLESGKVIVHIRAQNQSNDKMFTIYQSESYDGGKSFTKAHQVLTDRGGAPAHIICDKGVLISVYGYRDEPYGIRAMFSLDEGETWEINQVIVDDEKSSDLGYPSSVVLEDGRILTVYYAKSEMDGSSVIKQVIWNYSVE